MSVLKILILDDEQTARYGMRKALASEGRILEAATLQAGRKILQTQQPDLLLLDLNLGEEDGFQLLEEISGSSRSLPKVVVITAHGSEKIAVKAMKKGALDYLAKPFEVDELRLIVRNVARQISLQRENERLKSELAAVSGYGPIIGTSQAMAKVFDLIGKVAETDVSVLIVGESGTGKELVAREIHSRSQRRQGPLVTVNCAALPENLIESELFGHEKGAFTGALARRQGKFEQARGGTLFLDEIGDMPLETQAKILRALENRTIQRLGGQQELEVDVRILSATHQDLGKMVQERRFREDLYYRLEVVRIELPPLRQRPEDIPLLVDHFNRLFSRRHGRPPLEVSRQALALLTRYPYPGNVRQLRNLVERLVVLHPEGRLEEGDLPAEIRSYVPGLAEGGSALTLDSLFQLDFRRALKTFEKQYLLSRLREHQNNITHTAQAIGIHRQSLQQKIKDLDLRKEME